MTCEHCGYNGPVLETHVFYALLEEDRDHAKDLLRDSSQKEIWELGNQATRLMSLAINFME